VSDGRPGSVGCVFEEVGVSAAVERVTFERDIKPLFRPVDHESMAWAFDLLSYDEVKEHATTILSACATVRCLVMASGRKSRSLVSSGGPRPGCSSSAHATC
jgi:hypothetical protein